MYVQETASGHAGDIEKLHSTTGAHQNMLRDLLSATEAASTQVDALQGSMESVQGTVEQLWQNFSATTTSLREVRSEVLQMCRLLTVSLLCPSVHAAARHQRGSPP